MPWPRLTASSVRMLMIRLGNDFGSTSNRSVGVRWPLFRRVIRPQLNTFMRWRPSLGVNEVPRLSWPISGGSVCRHLPRRAANSVDE
jgi:hypothetical protein